MKANPGRKLSFLWFLPFITCSAVSAQVIDNPAKPKAENAGRMIAPREVLAIEDDGTNFFFKYPYNLKTGPDGSIFICDREQLLQFDKNGRFLRNLFKKGQGPGEMSGVAASAFPEPDGIAVQTRDPSKIIWFDGYGRLRKEVTLTPKSRIGSFLGKAGDLWMFEGYDIPRKTGEPGYIEVPHRIVIWNEKTSEWSDSASFDVTSFAMSSGNSAGMFSVARFSPAFLGDSLLAVCHTQEYLIKIFDVSVGRVIREFRRDYRRVPPPPLKPGQTKPRINLNGKIYEPPELKYAVDVSHLQIRGDRLWVFTSTVEKNKGMLIDVFAREGIFLDSFYLHLPEAGIEAFRNPWTCALSGDFLYAVERTEAETYVLKKYALPALEGD